MPVLIIRCDETKLSQRFLVRRDRFSVGRSSSADVRIRDASVSKVHLMIARNSFGWTFQDLWSGNGTFLDDKRKESGVLADGARLRLGKILIEFRLDAGEQVGPEARAGGSPPLAGAPAPAAAASAASPAPAPAAAPAAAPEARARIHPLSERVRRDIEFVRLVERHKGILIALTVGLGGIILGFLAGRLESVNPSKAPPAGEAAAVSETAAPAAALDAAPAATPAATPAAEVEALAGSLAAGPSRPYSGASEAERTLFRIFLDVLDRPPTRAEARELAALDHPTRWARVRALAAPEPAGPPAAKAAPPSKRRQTAREAAAAYRRFLGRAGSAAEERALAIATVEGAGGPADMGLLLSATEEYRAASRHRPRSARQRACSLIIDFLDRPPASDEEVRELEGALEKFPSGNAVARVLAFSEEGTRSLPRFSPPAAGGAGAAPSGSADPAAEWASVEIRRYLLRPPSEEELGMTVAAMGAGAEGARRARIALAGLPGYGSY